MRVLIETFGCQMNKLDSELVLGQLLEDGYEPARNRDEADVILVNTCSVRKHAEERAYSRIGSLSSLKKRNPNLIIGVFGCMAQKDKEEVLRRAPHVDIVCGPGEIDRMPELVSSAAASRLVSGAQGIMALDLSSPPRFDRRVDARPTPFQAFVSIMRGCNNFCSYCVVPYLRGRETSRPVDDIADEVRLLADDGVKEITLLGQNVDSYGRSLRPRKSLADLLAVINDIQGIERIRFVTSHPRDVTDELLDAVRDLPKVCEHLHAPAQSGSNRILAQMNRGYTSEGYRRLVERARERLPNIEIASDFIVGFPGETEEDFEATAELMRWTQFQNSFIFKYSPRPGTKAAELPDSVPLNKKKERNRTLLSIQEEISLRKHKAMIGKTVEVLVEGPSRRNPKRLSGRTRGNHIVVFEGNPQLAGSLVNVRVEDCTSLTLMGRIAVTP